MKAENRLLQKEAPDDYIREWVDFLANMPEKIEASEKISVLIFKWSTKLYALDTQCVQAVDEKREIHSIPKKTNETFKGITYAAGRSVLCMNLAMFFKKTPANEIKKNTKERLLLFKQKNGLWGIHVDEIIGLKKIEANKILCKKELDPLIKATFLLEGVEVIYLNDQILDQLFIKELMHE